LFVTCKDDQHKNKDGEESALAGDEDDSDDDDDDDDVAAAGDDSNMTCVNETLVTQLGSLFCNASA